MPAAFGGGSFIPEMSRMVSTPPSTVESDEITTLASYRPESAAFTFSFNRPKTGKRRQESDESGSAVGGRRAPPSAFRSRGNHIAGGGGRHDYTKLFYDFNSEVVHVSDLNWVKVYVNECSMNHVRAASSTRGNSFITEETVEFIPDLDDVNEEDLQMTVASAPA